jgi:hypothetical protein
MRSRFTLLSSLSLAFSLSFVALVGCTSSDGASDAGADASDAWRPTNDAPTIYEDTNEPDAEIVRDANVDAEIDATFGSDVGPACNPSGTYGLDWVPASTNPASCTTPAHSISVGSDGLSTGGMAPCAGAGCDSTACSATEATAASCTSVVHFVGPCHVTAGQTYDASFAFGADGSVEATVRTDLGDGTSCTFTASGTRS